MLSTSRNIISSDATTQEMIAPVIDTLVATKAWSVGEQFIYAGTLYKVTTAIAVGDTIVVSGASANCELADTITEQIKVNALDNFKTASGSVACDSTAGSKIVCSVNLTKGIWLIFGFCDLNTSLANDVMSMSVYPISKSARTTALGGGGIFNGGITQSQSNFTASVRAYTLNTWGSSVIVRGTIWAYKLGDL